MSIWELGDLILIFSGESFPGFFDCGLHLRFFDPSKLQQNSKEGTLRIEVLYFFPWHAAMEKMLLCKNKKTCLLHHL